MPHKQPLSPGTKVGRYTIDSVLAQGALGVTYRAHYDGNLFVLKAIEATDRAAGTRFPAVPPEKTGARQATREIFESGDATYYVMDYIAGCTLRDYVHERGRLSETEMLGLMLPVIKTMARLDYSHFDIKPSNIIVPADSDAYPHPVLIDFGLHIGGGREYTPCYGAPEQAAGNNRLTKAADVYALGATMLFCLTGKRPPESGQIADEYLARALEDVSPATAAVIKKAVSTNPAKRHADAAALLDDLDDDATQIIPRDAGRKHNLSMTWIAVIAVALLALLCWLTITVASRPDYSNYLPIEEAQAESME